MNEQEWLKDQLRKIDSLIAHHEKEVEEHPDNMAVHFCLKSLYAHRKDFADRLAEISGDES